MRESSGIFQAFCAAARKNPSKGSLFFKASGMYSGRAYEELFRRSVRLGNLLIERGVKAGDRVALMMRNGPDWPEAFLAIQYSGCIAVLLDANLSGRAAFSLMRHSGARVLLTSEEIHAQIAGGEVPVDADIIPMDSDIVARQVRSLSAEDSGRYGNVRADAPAVFFYTSGTTDAPKAVMLSHGNLIANASSIARVGRSDRLRETDVFISFLPLHHTYAFMVTFLVPLLNGAAASYPAMINSGEIMDCLRSTGVTVMAGVPQLFMLIHKDIRSRIEKLPGPYRRALRGMAECAWLLRRAFGLNVAKMIFGRIHRPFGGALRYMILGGAKLDLSVTTDFFKWGFTVLEGYGLTETSPIASMNTPDDLRIGSVGRPIPDVRIRIDSPDDKKEGEVAIKGPNVMLGYYQMPDETAKVLRDGWFLTGDLGRLDDGFLYIRGRKDDMLMLASGENINPEEIERRYLASPFIKEICVFMRKAGGYLKESDKLAAVVVPDEKAFAQSGGKADVEAKIRSEIERLSEGVRDYKRIKGFRLRREPLERTAIGKLKRNVIKEEYSKDEPDRDAAADRGDAASCAGDRLGDIPICSEALAHMSRALGRKVKLDDHIELDLGVDSLGRMELLMELQQAFKIEIPESELEDFYLSATVRELFTKASKYVKEREKL